MQFLEIGADLERGIDLDARAWVEAGWPTTYHFLDANLEERESLSDEYLEATRAQARERAARRGCAATRVSGTSARASAVTAC